MKGLSLFFKSALTVSAVFCSFGLKAQNADMSEALQIKETSYKFDQSPNGYGNSLEIKGENKKDPKTIEVEHHTKWMYFKSTSNCTLELEITPMSSNDDYDFMVFTSKDELVSNYNQLTVARTNISRNDKSLNSKTGLNATAVDEYVPSGVGPAYSKALEVVEGEWVYILVDNVYDDGQGFSFTVTDCFTKKVVEIVQPDTVKVIETPIAVVEEPDTVKEVVKVVVEPPVFETKEERELKKLVSKLNNAPKNTPFVFENIHYFGNSAYLKASAKVYLDEIYEYLKENEDVKMVFHGHTNGTNGGAKYFVPEKNTSDIFAKNDYDVIKKATVIRGNVKKLSLMRAQSIVQYLEKKGIDPSRLSCKGWGADKMLYSEFSDFAYKNRRVEIEIK